MMKIHVECLLIHVFDNFTLFCRGVFVFYITFCALTLVYLSLVKYICLLAVFETLLIVIGLVEICFTAVQCFSIQL